MISATSRARPVTTRPADFGAVAAFLASEPAWFVTGTTLLIDGGATRGI